MDKSKTTVTYTLEQDQIAWLEKMAAEHDLPDASKALRVLLDYAAEDGDQREIFGIIRCRHCG